MKEQMIKWCKENKIWINDLTPYQSRLRTPKGSKVVCDVYWVNKRFHIIKHPSPDMVQQRGDIVDVELFLESVFSNQ